MSALADFPGGQASAGWSIRAVLWVAVLAAFFLVPLGWIVLGATHVGGFSDSIDYLLVAEFFRDSFAGQLSPAVGERFASTRFPPLFPLILAALGAGGDNQVVAFWVSGIAAVLAIVAIWAWLRRELENVLAATWTTLAFASLPGLYLLLIYPVSETLYMALAYAALALAPARRERPIGLPTFGLMVGVVPLARTIGIALVAAACLWIALFPAASTRRKLLACGFAIAPAILWAAYRAALPNSDSYTNALGLATILGELGGWQGLLFGQPVRMFKGYVELLDPALGAPAQMLTGLLAVLTAVGLIRALAARKLEAWYLLCYWAVVWIWPYPHEISRLMLPSMPMVLLLSLNGAVAISARVAPRRLQAGNSRVAGIILLATLIVSGPMLAQFALRAVAPVGPGLDQFKRGETYLRHPSRDHAELILAFDARLYYAMLALKDAIPRGECIYSSLPEMVLLHGRVPVVSLPRGLDGSRPIRPQLRACRYFLVHQASTRQLGYRPMYPLELLESWTTPVFQSWETSAKGTYPAVMLLKSSDPDQAVAPPIGAQPRQ